MMLSFCLSVRLSVPLSSFLPNVVWGSASGDFLLLSPPTYLFNVQNKTFTVIKRLISMTIT